RVLNLNCLLHRQVDTQIPRQYSLELQRVHRTLVIKRLAQTFRSQEIARVGEVDGTGGKVHRKGHQTGDDIEQQAEAIENGHAGIDLAADLPAPLGIENGAAGGELGDQGSAQQDAGQSLQTHCWTLTYRQVTGCANYT